MGPSAIAEQVIGKKRSRPSRSVQDHLLDPQGIGQADGFCKGASMADPRPQTSGKSSGRDEAPSNSAALRNLSSLNVTAGWAWDAISLRTLQRKRHCRKCKAGCLKDCGIDLQPNSNIFESMGLVLSALLPPEPEGVGISRTARREIGCGLRGKCVSNG